MKKSPETYSPSTRRRVRLGALLLGVTAVGTLFAIGSIWREDRRMREELLQQTYLVAQAIPLDRLWPLTGDPSDEQKAEYRQLKEQLRATVQINPLWKWIYLMGRDKEGTVFFRLDSVADDAPEVSPPGQSYEEASPLLQNVFDTRQSATEGPFPDRWGTWVSSFVPLANPKTDEIDTVLGIDIDASHWRMKAARAGSVPLLAMAMLLIILSAAYRLRMKNEEASEIKQRPRWHPRSASTVAVGLTLTLMLVWFAHSVDVRQTKKAFEALALMKTGYVLNSFHSLRNAEIEGLARFLENRREVTSEEFRRYAEYLGRMPEVMAWAWVPAVKGKNADGEGGEIRYPIHYIEPPAACEELGIPPGFDLGTIESVRATLDEAARNGLVLATTLFPSTQRTNQPGNILILRSVRGTGPDRALKGFAMAAVDPEILLQSLLKANPSGDPFISIDLMQLRAGSPPKRLASTVDPEHRVASTDLWFGPQTLTRPILAFGQTYAVSARLTPELIDMHATYLAWLALLAGLSITLASATVTGFVVHRREDMERLVDERTFELASSMRRYDQLAQQSRTIAWETDADGLYTDISPVLEDVLGYLPQDLIGKRHFHEDHPGEGRDAFQTMISKLFARRRPLLSLIHPRISASGEVVWLSTNGMPLLNPDGSLRGYQGTDQDITDRKHAEESLATLAEQNKEAAERYATLISASNTGAWEYHDDTAYMWASPEYFTMLGRDISDFNVANGQPNIDEIWLNLLHPDDKDAARQYFIDYMRKPADIYEHTFRMLHADGHWVWVLSRGRALRDAQGRSTAVVVGTHIDISESKRAEQYRDMGVKTLQILNEPDDLNDLLQRLVSMFKESTDFDAVGIRLQSGNRFPYVVQEGFSSDFLASDNDLVDRDADGNPLLDEEGHMRLRCTCGLVLSGKTDPASPLFTTGGSCWTNDALALTNLPSGEDPRQMPLNRCIRDGFASIALVPIRNQNQIFGLLQFNDRRKDRFSLETLQILEGIAAHIGEALTRKRVEQDYRILFHEMLEGFAVHEIVCDAQGQPIDYRFLAMNPAFERLTGLSARDLVGKTVLEALPQTERYWIETFGKVALTGEPAFFEQYSATLDRHFEVTAFRNAPNQFACIFDDITARKRAEAERERLNRAIEQSGETIVITDAAGTILYVNPAFTQTSGYSQEEAVGQNPRILQSERHDREFYREMWETLNAGDTWEGQIVNKSKNGELYTEQASISPVRDAAGRVVNFVAVKRDITSQLADQEEKENLQTQLLQAQKMESIGRLAGGVAHDFNNMLQAILGYTEMALEQVDPNLPLHHDIREIQKAARRSALLTRQLQTFARKQAAVPKVIDINMAIEGMVGMLRRMVGDKIRLEWKTEENLHFVRMDPGQFDQIVTNLCVNARDAVGESGHIILSARNVALGHAVRGMHGGIEAGSYVRLTIADNGCGMTQDLIDQIFEPFFTTKKAGQGTGLGLATVYGIVKQNRGGIRVRSAPGEGSTFQIFLPRHIGEIPPAELLTDSEAPISHGDETILLVEDEKTILHATGRMLASLGYSVLATPSSNEALRLFAEHQDQIRLLLTDVIMPEMNGPDLVKKLLESQPNLTHLYMSGYTSNLLEEQGVSENSANFVQKPFSRVTLAQKVRTILDGA